MTAEQTRFRVLSLNAWALPITVPFQDKRGRTARLPEALRSVDADVIVLQEAFDPKVRRALVEAFRQTHSVAADALALRRVLGVSFDTHGGILVLSQFALADTHFEPHPLPAGSKITERLGRKGALFATVKIPTGDLHLVAPHFYAGTRPSDSRVRRVQLAALLDVLDDRASDRPTVFAGDFNFPPEEYHDGRASEMDLLRAAGFHDTIVSSNGQSHATWSYSRNRYTKKWLHPNRSDMRFDYVLFRQGGGARLENVGASIVLDTPGAEVSDHFGVLAELRLQGYSS